MDGTWECVDVTPEMAKQWLETMRPNRNLTQSRAEMYADAMAKGDWQLTHQGVAFDCHGQLADGQTRLHAIILSGCTVRMWVFRGLSDEAVMAIDGGQGRKAHQQLAVAGIEATSTELAVIKRIVYGTKKDKGVSSFDFQRYLDVYGQAIRTVLTEFGGKRGGVTHSAVTSVVCRAVLANADWDRVKEFVRVLRTGEMQSPEDNAAIKLRDLLLTRGRGGGQRTLAEIYTRAEFALDAFLRRRHIPQLRAAQRELFEVNTNGI